MIALMKRHDPAEGKQADSERIRALFDEKIGVTTTLHDRPRARPRVWLVATASFVLIVAVALPTLIQRSGGGPVSPVFGALLRHPGVDAVVPLASSGVQTPAVEGDTIWVMSSLSHQLQEVAAATGELMVSHDVDAYVEGVVPGGGFIWLLSYDDGGQVLRFDPGADRVDLAVSIGGEPRHAVWAGESLWVSNDRGDLHRIDVDGEIVATRRGELKGEGLGYLWVNDPETGLISNLGYDGAAGDVVIPTYGGLETADGWGVRTLIEAGGDLWLLDDTYPWGTNLSRFDPSTGELSSFVSITFGLLGFTEFDGYLWVASATDNLVARIDPITAEVVRYPLPGKTAGLFVADGALWATVYQWGSLARLDPDVLPEASPISVDDWNRFPHRLLCAGDREAEGPTIILEPYDWIDYGSWSVVQSMLAAEGLLVCANGFVEGESTPQVRAAQLSEALDEAGLTGPFILVASGDGVHATRLFADGRDDVAGVVLVDPMPLGFPTFLDRQQSLGGHPEWSDLTAEMAATLDDFGDTPLTVIGHDPREVYLSPRYIDGFGQATADAIEGYWRAGLDYYADLSTDSTELVARGGGLMIMWDDPDLVVDQILEMVD